MNRKQTPYLWARMRASLSQQDAAAKAGLDVATLSRIERGHQEPRLDTLRKLADTYQITLDELCGRETP